MSLTPVATEFGQKMRIHQSSCNKDYSCALGDCPSFVTVKIKEGTGLRRRPVPALPAAEVPPPARMAGIAAGGYRIVMPGIGGTGVVTINALIATAAWIDGLNVLTLDQTGTAQKGGAVVSHVLLTTTPLDAPSRTNAGNADLILGFDLIGVANPENLRVASPERTAAVVNTDLVPTIDSIRSHTVLAGPERMLAEVTRFTRAGHNVHVDANRIAESLFGSHLAANVFLLGVAWQAGLVPVSLQSIEQAITLNGVEVAKNRQAFLWGRKYYHDAAWVEQHLAPASERETPAADRLLELRAYQNDAWARSYVEFLEQVERRAPALKDTVARNLYKLMAYKDEYEVARLLTKPDFQRRLHDQWESIEAVSYNLHPPLLRRFGVTKKLKLGPWFRVPLRLLASMKGLRGTPLDVFGWSAHRRMERELIDWYKDLIHRVMDHYDPSNPAPALEIAALPDQIRGYEQIKEQSVAAVRKTAEEKLAALTAPALASTML
jgi:indolepyruvate ferredoxin oxidoreductase